MAQMDRMSRNGGIGSEIIYDESDLSTKQELQITAIRRVLIEISLCQRVIKSFADLVAMNKYGTP